MATIRSYSATFEHTTVANAALTRWRFNEDAGATIALDSVDALDGSYEAGAAPGDGGTIGDGAARFDGATGLVLVETLSGTITISAFGDSLIAGGDIPVEADRFSPNLEAALAARGLDATVINRGVGGDRTVDGLARLTEVTEIDQPDVAIVEFGTNDAINDIPLANVEANLRSIIGQAGDSDGITGLTEAGIEVLLTGTFGFFPERRANGAGYDTEPLRSDFEALFPTIAASLDVELLNDAEGSDKFLGGERIPGSPDTISGGVLGAPSLQAGFPDNPDGLHPNAAGIDEIVARIVPQTVALGAAAGAVNEPLLLANGSFEFWFTADSISGDHALVAKNSLGQGTGGQFAIFTRNGGAVRFALGDEQQNVVIDSATGVVEANQPTHLVATFGAGGMQLFVDGNLVASNPSYTGGLDAGLGNFEQLVIGAESGSSTPGTVDGLSRFFDGAIDEVAVYDRALTVGEIQQLFVGGGLGTSVLGTANADTIFGGSDDEDLRGAFGADTILARGGDDALRGGAGPDDLRGGSGDDRLFGGSGADAMSGAAGADRLLGHGGKDDLSGGAGEDLLDGDGGRDSLAGGADADRLFGGPAVDHLSGGAGDDLLNGGPGRDSLLGGADADTFRIDRLNDGIDRVRDFAPGEGDVLDLSAVLDFTGGDDANDFVQLNDVSGHTNVDVDPNGAGGDFTTVFRLIGTTGLNLDTLVAAGNVQLEPPTS